jgi:hypothetical protein
VVQDTGALGIILMGVMTVVGCFLCHSREWTLRVNDFYFKETLPVAPVRILCKR